MKLKSNIIILAAGQSTRMGQPKALLPFKAKTLLEFQIDSVISMGIKPVVILGYHFQAIEKAIPDLKNRAETIINPHPEQGQFSSILTGLKHGSPKPTFILPLDTPAPLQDTWEQLESHLNSYYVVVPKFDGRGGHPVLLSSAFVSELCEGEIAESEKRLDLQIKKLKPESYFSLTVKDPGVLVDLDTPAEVARYFKCL
jgi:molybdenum cofactor cytidylyltransferase